jgi:hypothetical protein
MQRRQFLSGSLAAAACWPARELFAQNLAFLTQTIGELPARTLAGRDRTLAGADVEALAASLRGDLLLPGSVDYETARHIWNGVFDRRPALIARCSGAADVIRAVNFAREFELLTAIRGGGHSYSGKSTCDGGIMIDLSAMRGARVDPHARTARVAGGSLLGDLDHEAQQFGLATTAGVISHTGAAGLTLGGGFGRLGRRFGLACDNLIAADIVTAGGAYLRVSETERADLLWGLRGGGGNFGVVTSFEYRLHPVDRMVLGGAVAWPVHQAREVMRFFADYSREAPDELYLACYLLPPRDGPAMVLVSGCWSAEHGKGEEILKPLRSFGPPASDSFGPIDYVALQCGSDKAVPHGRKYYSKSGFTGELDDDAIDLILDVFNGSPRPYTMLLELFAFPNRDARYWFGTSAGWEDPAQSDAQISVMRSEWQRLQPLTQGFYINAAVDETPERFRSNFGQNFARLVALKDQYDPTNQFRLNANVPPSSG